jgi:hypothetical protein
VNEQQKIELGKKIAPIVRSAVGALNHTRIGYTSEHDAMADPFIGEILEVFESELAAKVAEARREERLYFVNQMLGNEDWNIPSEAPDRPLLTDRMLDVLEREAEMLTPHPKKPKQEDA